MTPQLFASRADRYPVPEMEQSTATPVTHHDPKVVSPRLERAFSMAMVVSGVRCVLAYIVLPFATPFLGLAPGVGPALGMGIGVLAIAANVVSMRRFWRTRHRWRRPVTVIHLLVIAFLLVLIAIDVGELVG